MSRPELARRAATAAALAAVLLPAGCGSEDEETTGAPTSGAAQADRLPALDVSKLPLGDGRFMPAPEKRYVFSCQTQFEGPGALEPGPWINERAKTWDLTKKVAVGGAVKWGSRFTADEEGSNRTLSGNGLPPNRTGEFPIQRDDPAFRYDHNPNSIKPFALRASLPADPEPAAQLGCVGGTIGVTNTGVPLFSAFDADGNDAPAHEVQDRCEGHPQVTGQYHFHSLSSCVGDRRAENGHSPLIGWALDGFGIYGQYGEGGEQMTTAKLDLCHGHTHEIEWNGERRRMFHYHATLDFPYMVGCYRGTPITKTEGLQIGRPGGGQGAGASPPEGVLAGGGSPPQPWPSSR